MSEHQSRNEPREKALAAFMEYFRANYPGPDTIISRPDWHAPKIFRAVEQALKEAGLMATPSETALNKAAQDVLDERKRQVEKEGWSTGHDDGHGPGTMAVAGACYALDAAKQVTAEHPTWARTYENSAADLWPWDAEWWKPKDARRDLVRAAALLLAEIERIDRSAK